MKKAILIVCFVFVKQARSQSVAQIYSVLVKKADSLYKIKSYKESAYAYSAAFKSNSWKGMAEDRYAAACSYAMAHIPDSAFFNLFRLTEKLMYSDYRRVTNDPDLDPLHKDKRWTLLLEKLLANKEKKEEGYNKKLVTELDSIYQEDQKYRLQMDEIGKKYGWQSKEMIFLWGIARTKDSINLIKVKAILDTYGWLGPEVVGQQGNTTLFLVIQHSDQKTQEKYLPMMREAVKNKKASPSSLALLEDRVALGQGKKQIYGSQIGRDANDKQYVLPLEDPDNVDKRRAEVGLQPLQEYVSHWGIKWNAEEYKKSEAFTKGGSDGPNISSVQLDETQILKWTVQNESSKETVSIEQFRWGKWIKIDEVETAPGTALYTFEVPLHHGENKFKISVGNRSSEAITYTSAHPAVTCKISGRSNEIRFSSKTLFEIIDASGKVVKKGFTEKA
ncbi:MAG: DUF6624 domain-containing protein, partial [Bacteroidia bacterium]